jgi:hypothetical protein
MKKFVPNSATVPTGIETPDFRIRPLTINDVVKDYDAVMSSVNHLRKIFGPNSSWPSERLTLEQDLIDLGWHQKEFQNQTSFAFTVMTIDESKCLGCVYVYPSEKINYDAKVFLWVRESERNNGLDENLFFAVQQWLSEKWWFDKIAFPGRLISWQEWQSIPDK